MIEKHLNVKDLLMKFYAKKTVTLSDLEAYLIFFEPEAHLQKIVKTARDVYEHRTALKQIPGK